MFYYLVTDVGKVKEIESFVKNDVSSSSPPLSFPHKVLILTGHAGTGKTNLLKYFANDPRTMFCAPTNSAGINLQNVLWPTMLFASGKKRVFRTIHSFYKIKPDETEILGENVQRNRRKYATNGSYDDYLQVMYKGCESFCENLCKKEIETRKLSPEDYKSFQEECGCESEANHETVLEHIRSRGKFNKIPSILLFDTFILEEAGRTPDYLAYLFLFYHAFMHAKYRTRRRLKTMPILVFVGSPTQSRVIDKYTSYSALTFAGQPCVYRHIIESHGDFMIKSLKDNRRVTAGNIESNSTLAAIISKLELGLCVPDRLKRKFNSSFVVSEGVEKFFDPLFKPSYFRIAKRHSDLKRFKTRVFDENRNKAVSCFEYFLTNIEAPSFFDIEKHVNVKLKSETYTNVCWRNTGKTSELYDRKYLVYENSRIFLIGFTYLLTEYHTMYMQNFSGTIQQFLELTDRLHSQILSESGNCLSFFVNCAKYIIEDHYSNDTEEVMDSLNDLLGQEEENAQQLIAMKTAIRQITSKKIYTYTNEERSSGMRIALPKDTFTFVLLDVVNVGTNHTFFFLKFGECLTLKMYAKIKAVSTCKIAGKRMRDDDDDCSDGDTDLVFQALEELDNKSFFRIAPLSLHICSTIDATQGLTIDAPIFALLGEKQNRAEDIIVALTRSRNPDNLLVANKVFDHRFEPIDRATAFLVRLINSMQKNDGWL